VDKWKSNYTEILKTGFLAEMLCLEYIYKYGKKGRKHGKKGDIIYGRLKLSYIYVIWKEYL